MKPFFSYYGSKYRLCQQGFYPAPKTGNVVIEPFAGSATYSVFHEPERAILIDSSPDIVNVWDYLMNAREEYIALLPNFQDVIYAGCESTPLDIISAEYQDLPQGAKNLIGFWMGKAQTKPVQSITNWFVKYHDKPSCMVWNEYVKERIIKQLPKIRDWVIIEGQYPLADDITAYDNPEFATVFIDPPYSGKAGRKYKHNTINYQYLEWWISQNPKSQIIACENQDLTHRWADFNQTAEAFNMRGKKQELVWVQG